LFIKKEGNSLKFFLFFLDSILEFLRKSLAMFRLWELILKVSVSSHRFSNLFNSGIGRSWKKLQFELIHKICKLNRIFWFPSLLLLIYILLNWETNSKSFSFENSYFKLTPSSENSHFLCFEKKITVKWKVKKKFSLLFLSKFITNFFSWSKYFFFFFLPTSHWTLTK